MTTDDPISGKLIQKAGVDTPSPAFTDKVMNGILANERKESFTYEPVLTKKAWLIIAAFTIFLIALVISASGDAREIYFPSYHQYFDRIINSIAFSSKAMTLSIVSILGIGILLLLDNYRTSRSGV